MSGRREREQFCWQTKLSLAPTGWVPNWRRTALPVVNRRWLALARHQLSPDGALAEKRATWRQPTPSSDTARRIAPKNRRKRSWAPRNANQRQSAPSSSPPWRQAFVYPARKKVLGSSNFWRGKTDNPCASTMTSRSEPHEQTISPEADPYPAFRVHLKEITAWLESGCSMKSVWRAYAARGAFPGSYRTFLRYCQNHALAPRRKKTGAEDPAIGEAAPSPAERDGATSPTKSIEDGKSRRPVGSALGRLNLFPPPLERPRQFVPTEED